MIAHRPRPGGYLNGTCQECHSPVRLHLRWYQRLARRFTRQKAAQ